MVYKVYVEGYGCVLNQADTLIIKNSLKKEGFIITDNIDYADIIIINTCIVRLETENRMLFRIEELKKLNKILFVAGCMPKGLKEKIKGLPYILPREAHNAGKIVKDYLTKKNIIHKEDNLTLFNKLYLIEPSLITPLPICEGCLGECSYCIVKLARGDLISYPRDVIVERAKYLIERGTKCLFITAQDTACYGFDRGDNLANLLRDLCEIEGDFIMRIGMMHPKSLERIIDDVIEVYKEDKIGKFLHLPLQSGSDKILKLMKRGYTVDEYISLVKEFRKKIKNLCYVTDIIVGFPGEEEEDFEETLNILKKLKPDYIHAAKYTVRKGTLASKMKQIDSKIKKNRSRILDKLRRELSYLSNKKYVGKTLRALIVDKNKGYTENFKVVKVDCEDIGKFINVKITEAKTFGLKGEKL